MSELNLNFLDDGYSKSQTTIVDLLEKYGSEITNYAKDYFQHIVSPLIVDGEVKTVSLYINALDIGYEYKILVFDILNIQVVKVNFFPLDNSKPLSMNIGIKEGFETVEKKIQEFLGSTAANHSLGLLAKKIDLYRKAQEENETT